MNNNPRFDTSTAKSPDAIRSEIDTTRRRMDDTIDALSSRLKGRHLIDEILGYVRSHSEGSRAKASQIGGKVADSATTAMHTAIDTVKAHPLPTALVAAGVAWMIYQKQRPQRSELDYDPDYDSYEGPTGWEEDVAYGSATSGYNVAESGFTTPPGTSAAAGYSGEALAGYGTGDTGGRGRMDNLKNKLGQKASAAREQLRSRTSSLQQRSKEKAQIMRDRMQSGYTATRERVVTTVDTHPLESGLACLALGIVAGLLIPAPRAVTRMAGPTVSRLGDQARQRGRELVDKGRHVAEAASRAAREEAESQGLTPEGLKEKAGAVAQRARSAATETAEEEGIRPGQSEGRSNAPAGGNSPGF